MPTVVDRELIKDWIVGAGGITAARELMSAYHLDAMAAYRLIADLIDELAAEEEA